MTGQLWRKHPCVVVLDASFRAKPRSKINSASDHAANGKAVQTFTMRNSSNRFVCGVKHMKEAYCLHLRWLKNTEGKRINYGPLEYKDIVNNANP
jgi:hypothetical protein